ncbi:hypothetical protein [Streptomyces sp. NPDC057696]|uniref:hypothetical protein n=1 Tax=Streptomyces sp. NPDC057696 TaxID=3346218 RepID=UPI0036B2BBD9
MGRPITETDRRAVRRHHAAGMTRNAIAKKIKRSPSTVSNLAAQMDLSFERGPEVIAAIEARRIDLAARRAQDLHDDAEKLCVQLWEPMASSPAATANGTRLISSAHGSPTNARSSSSPPRPARRAPSGCVRCSERSARR